MNSTTTIKKKMVDEAEKQMKEIFSNAIISQSHINTWNKIFSISVLFKTHHPEIAACSELIAGSGFEANRCTANKQWNANDDRTDFGFTVILELERKITEQEIIDIYREEEYVNSRSDIKSCVEDPYHIEDFLECADAYYNATKNNNIELHEEVKKPLMEAKEAAENFKQKLVDLSKYIK